MQLGWGFDDHETTWLFEFGTFKINAVPTNTLPDTRGNTRGSASNSLTGSPSDLVKISVQSQARKKPTVFSTLISWNPRFNRAKFLDDGRSGRNYHLIQ